MRDGLLNDIETINCWNELSVSLCVDIIPFFSESEYSMSGHGKCWSTLLKQEKTERAWDPPLIKGATDHVYYQISESNSDA